MQVQNVDQLHAYDGYQNATELQTTEYHKKYTCVQHRNCESGLAKACCTQAGPAHTAGHVAVSQARPNKRCKFLTRTQNEIPLAREQGWIWHPQTSCNMLITVHVLCMPWEMHVYHRWTGVHISPFRQGWESDASLRTGHTSKLLKCIQGWVNSLMTKWLRNKAVCYTLQVSIVREAV